MSLLQDSFGRRFPYIRLSITDVCNFKCGYCLPNGYQKDKSDNRTLLSLEEVQRLAKGLSQLGISKIRLTGGEPTVRKDFFDIVKILKQNSGIKKTVITTNGYKLNQLAEQIVDQQLHRNKRVGFANDFLMNDSTIESFKGKLDFYFNLYNKLADGSKN